MRPIEVLKEIRSGKTRPLYLIFGEEEYWHEKIIQALTLSFPSGAQVFSADEMDWGGFLDLCSQPSFFGPSLYVVKRADALLPKEEYVPLAVAPANSCVLSSSSKTNPFGKALSSSAKDLDGVLVESTHPSFYEANQWVQDEFRAKGFKVSKDAAETLVSVVGRHMQSLEKEAEKIMLFLSPKAIGAGKLTAGESSETRPMPEVTKSVVLSCVSPSSDTNTFALIDAVAQRNPVRASSEIEELLARGVNEILIISTLGSHFGLIWRAKEENGKGVPQNDVAKTLGVHPYSAKKALEQSKSWSFADLEKALRLLCEVDESIKNGIQDPQNAMKHLVFGLTQGLSL